MPEQPLPTGTMRARYLYYDHTTGEQVFAVHQHELPPLAMASMIERSLAMFLALEAAPALLPYVRLALHEGDMTQEEFQSAIITLHMEMQQFMGGDTGAGMVNWCKAYLAWYEQRRTPILGHGTLDTGPWPPAALEGDQP